MGALASALSALAVASAASPAIADGPCKGPPPKIGQVLHGAVLFVPDGRRLCVAPRPSPDSWTEVELESGGLWPGASPSADLSKAALMSVAFAKTADCTVTASFVAAPPVTHVVTPTASAGGSITPNVPQTVQDGDTVEFTVAADAGFDLANVTGCGGSLSDLVYTTAPVTADCTVFASFTEHGDDTIFRNGFDPN